MCVPVDFRDYIAIESRMPPLTVLAAGHLLPVLGESLGLRSSLEGATVDVKIKQN